MFTTILPKWLCLFTYFISEFPHATDGTTVKPLSIVSEVTAENKRWMCEKIGKHFNVLYTRENKKINILHFYFGLKIEQIKATLKYLSTNNFLCVCC
jgi:hypothetical protein